MDKLRFAHRLLLSSSLETFTTKMFQYMNKTPYIMGEHHRKICNILDKVIRGEEGYRKIIINIAPRYGKTLLVSQMFIAYGFAKNPQCKFLHLSYSGSLTQDNSIAVKDIISSEYYSAVFDTRTRVGSNTKSKWETEQGGGEYATSTLGQITGFGAGRTDVEDDDKYIDEYTAFWNSGKFNGAVVIDDPIKPEDALSDNAREAVNRRFETTIRNRVNSRNTPIIIIMQRLHEHDLCGYLQEVEPNEWKVLSLPCIYTDEQGNERALWDFKHTLDELYKLKDINPFVFETQYMQNPKPLEGLMYEHPFKTYEIIPYERNPKRYCYVDSADTGADYLCAICYEQQKDAVYVTDILYTKKPMEYTEQALAKMLCQNRTMKCIIESNNGGRIFMRNVEKICRNMNNHYTYFEGYTQHQNKQQKIFLHANEVNNMIIFPEGWETEWVEFSTHVRSYRREGINAHDDAEDVLSEIVIRLNNSSTTLTNKQLINMGL